MKIRTLIVASLMIAAAACNAPGAAESQDPSSSGTGAGAPSGPEATGDRAGASGNTGTGTGTGIGTENGTGAAVSYTAPTRRDLAFVSSMLRRTRSPPFSSRSRRWTRCSRRDGPPSSTASKAWISSRCRTANSWTSGLLRYRQGRVGQLRLVLVAGGDHHVVTPDGVTHALSVPSGEASGIKLVGGFDVPACGTGPVTMDFDGSRSLQVLSMGKNAGQWSMRPVIRLKSVATRGDCADGGADLDAGRETSAPAADPCADITCTDTETCVNGSCQTSM